MINRLTEYLTPFTDVLKGGGGEGFAIGYFNLILINKISTPFREIPAVLIPSDRTGNYITSFLPLRHYNYY